MSPLRRCGGCELALDEEGLLCAPWDRWLGLWFCSAACALIDGWLAGDRP